jgi:hypothetical protein
VPHVDDLVEQRLKQIVLTATLRWARLASPFAHRPYRVQPHRGAPQLPAEVFVAALADSEQFWLAAGGEQPRNETKPRSKIAPTVKDIRPPDGGDEGRCDDRADPGVGAEPSGAAPTPRYSSISTNRNCSSFRLPCGATLPLFQQDGAQLIDQRRLFDDQPVSRPMKRLVVALVLTLQLDETHRRPRCSFRDPRGVAIVVLLRLDITRCARRQGPH